MDHIEQLDDPINDKPMPLLDHLMELRRRLMFAMAAFLVAFGVCYFFSGPDIFLPGEAAGAGAATTRHASAAPDLHAALRGVLYEDQSGDVRRAVSGISDHRLAIMAVHRTRTDRSEKRALLPFLIASPVLFVMGAALAYFVVFPFAWRFFASFQSPTAGGGVPDRADAAGKRVSRPGHEADLRVRHHLPASRAADIAGQGGDRQFQGPRRFRRYAYVGMFVIAAILAPPDVITQCSLALPLILLYEISVVSARMVERKPVNPEICTISAPIRADPAGFDAAMARRGLPPVSPEILAVDNERRAAQTRFQELQTRRNALARTIGQKKRSGEDTAPLEAEATSLRAETETLERQAATLDDQITRLLEVLPNRLDPDVPDGADEAANVVLARHGTPRDLGFQPKQHFELGEASGLMDFAAAAKLAGTRFTLLRGPLARLERALGQFMIDLHTREHGYREISVPLLVNDADRVRHRQAAQVRRHDVSHHGRSLADPHRRGAADCPGNGRDHPGTRAALAGDRADAVLPKRSGRSGAGYARHASPAPVLQGGAGLGHASRP